MKTLVTRDGWFFVSQSLTEILEVVKDEFLFNIESVEALLFGKEQFILLKTIVPPEEAEVEGQFYATKHNIIANIEKNRSIDINIKSNEVHFGGGIYREGNNWNLFIPLGV